MAIVRARVRNLLIRRPDTVVAAVRRIMQKQDQWDQQNERAFAICCRGLQKGQTEHHSTQPSPRRKHQPAHPQEHQNSGQAPCQVPRVCRQGIRGQVQLPADNLAEGNEDLHQEHEQDDRQDGSTQEVDPVPQTARTPDLDVGRRAKILLNGI